METVEIDKKGYEELKKYKTKAVIPMKCELCNAEMNTKPIRNAIQYDCPNGCMVTMATDLWTATEYHAQADDDGFYTLYESRDK